MQNAFTAESILPNSHALVVGLGKSGLSAVNFLKQKGVRVSVSDARPLERIDGHVIEKLTGDTVRLEAGRHSEELFTSVDFIVVSPGVPLDISALKKACARGIPVIGELGLAACFLRTPVVAVTGTNGKSTVVTLLGEFFKASGKKPFVGGNIGTPLIDYIAGPQDGDVVVVEVSSFQLDTAGRFRPEVAILLNISADHLDRYESYKAYAESKFRIFAHQGEKDRAILNADDPEIMKYQGKSDSAGRIPWSRSPVFYYGEHFQASDGARVRDGQIVLFGKAAPSGNEEVYDLSGTHLATRINIQNCMASIIAARCMGCPRESIRKAIAAFVPLPHRLEFVGEIGGVRYYDDSKATNVGAVRSALAGMASRVVLIAGGRDKGGDYGVLNELVREKVKAMVLIGEAAPKMAETFHLITQTERADSLSQAVHRASEIARSGEVVLLSPACSSFDMFTDYGHRGRVFAEAVKSLEQN